MMIFMKYLSAEETYEIILRADFLNSIGRHHEAIDLIEKDLEQFDPDLKINGLKEVLKAAKALSHLPKAREVAKEIAKKHPKMTMIQPFLE